MSKDKTRGSYKKLLTEGDARADRSTLRRWKVREIQGMFAK